MVYNKRKVSECNLELSSLRKQQSLMGEMAQTLGVTSAIQCKEERVGGRGRPGAEACDLEAALSWRFGGVREVGKEVPCSAANVRPAASRGKSGGCCAGSSGAKAVSASSLRPPGCRWRGWPAPRTGESPEKLIVRAEGAGCLCTKPKPPGELLETGAPRRKGPSIPSTYLGDWATEPSSASRSNGNQIK